MSSTVGETSSFSFSIDRANVEGKDPLLPYPYDDSSKEENRSFDELPEQLSSRVYEDNSRLPLWIPKQLDVSALLNLILLIVVIVSLAAHFSSTQSLLAKILANDAANQPTRIVPARNSTWKLDNASSLVVFGDSYSAEVELGYFLEHFQHPEKVEWKTLINHDTATGGFVWARWAAWYTGAKVFNYAVGGAVCSTSITPHAGALGIQEHELPSFLADVAQTKEVKRPMVDTPSDSTVYTISIGTNDLGNVGFLTQDQVYGKTLDDWIGCIFEAIDRIYQIGGRHFVVMNVVPLDRSPTYNSVENGGVVSGAYWQDKPKDSKSVAIRMGQFVASVNYALRYQAAYEMQISSRYPDAKLAYFDVHRLFSDIISDPERFLNGTARADVTGSCVSCRNGDCTTCTSRDSYLWFDELHPSEQASRIIAKEFQRIIGGSSPYAEYWEAVAAPKS